MPATKAAKSPADGLRHDLEPLTSRFAQLGAASEATWFGGQLGDPQIPGPSLYWIDAVVTLPADAYDELAGLGTLAPAGTPPAVYAELEPFLPTGALLRSDALDADFSGGKFDSQVFLNKESSALILVTLFE